MSDIKQSDNAEKLYDMLIDKSKESFMMAIEVYNKPTIKYRVEGFSMFICNAWELMLKAYLIKERGMSSIYFSDHPDRTISLHECVKKVFTNDKDPLRMNLEKIIELRNTSTHFITQEYEMVYVPLFQSCILNFNDKMMDLHNIDMTDVIPQNFLSLSVSLKSLSENEIKAKYPEIVSKKLIKAQHDIENSSAINNPRYAITVNVNHFLTKKRNDADAVFHLARDGEQPLAVVKELKNPEDEYIACTSTGSPITENTRRYLWRSYTRAINIAMGCRTYRSALIPPLPLAPDLVPYCLRHEYCTDLARKGVDIRVAQKLMGHSDISLTANIYTNLQRDDLQDVGATLGATLKGCKRVQNGKADESAEE